MGEAIVITGAPRTGKTTLARKMDPNARSGDSLIDMGWTESAVEAAKWLDDKSVLVAEGVLMVRALRNWMRDHETGKPASRVLFLTKPVVDKLLPGQVRMAKGTRNQFESIRKELEKRGTIVEIR